MVVGVNVVFMVDTGSFKKSSIFHFNDKEYDFKKTYVEYDDDLGKKVNSTIVTHHIIKSRLKVDVVIVIRMEWINRDFSKVKKSICIIFLAN